MFAAPIYLNHFKMLNPLVLATETCNVHVTSLILLMITNNHFKERYFCKDSSEITVQFDIQRHSTYAPYLPGEKLVFDWPNESALVVPPFAVFIVFVFI